MARNFLGPGGGAAVADAPFIPSPAAPAGGNYLVYDAAANAGQGGWVAATLPSFARTDQANTFTVGGHLIQNASDTPALRIRAHSTQTASLTEWQNNSGTALAQVNDRGWLGLGTAPTGQVHLAGTVADADKLRVMGTITATTTAQRNAFINQTTFDCSAAATIFGLINLPTIGGSASLTNVYGAYGRVDQAGGYTGTITNAHAFTAATPTLASGTNPITNYTGYYVGTLSNGNGRTSGTTTNRGFYGIGITAAAAAGGTINNYGIDIAVPSGSGAGTTSNQGIRITGNGGTGGTGTTMNYAIYSTSTAESYLTGNIAFDNSGIGPVLKSANGTRYRITVSDAGALSTVAA